MSKIVIVGPASPLRGGIADFNEALACELIAQRHEVVIVSFSMQYPSFLFQVKANSVKTPKPIILIKFIRSLIPSILFLGTKRLNSL